MKRKLLSLLLVLALVFSNTTFAIAADNEYLTEEQRISAYSEYRKARYY